MFSHHTLRTTRQPNTDVEEQPVHYGQRVDRDNLLNPQNPSGEETLEELFCEFDEVIAHVTGHEHNNYVRHHTCEEEPVAPTAGTGDFYEVSTAAHIDWPQQSRTIELVDLGGRIALVLTMLDHAGPPRPAGRQDAASASDQVSRLASIARELAYNDYQQSRDSSGNVNAQGSRADRNVILPTSRPAP